MLYGPDIRSSLGAGSAWVPAVWVAGFGALARLAADIGFVHLDNASEQVAMICLRHCFPDLRGDPRASILVHLDLARQLQGRKSLLGVQRERDRQKSLLQRQMGSVEDRAYRDAETRPAVIAAMALFVRRGVLGTAVGANWRAVRPTHRFQVSDAVLMRWKSLEGRHDVPSPCSQVDS